MMIISGRLDLAPSTHAASTSTMRERLADLDERRRAAERTVEAVLTTWRGDAAEAFRSRWEDWSGAATGVIDDLAAGVLALDQARLDLVAADSLAAESSDALVERLG